MPKTPLSFYLHIIAVAVVVFAVGRYLPLPLAGEGRGEGVTLATPAKESAYDRVMRTGTIRCGYYMFAPVSMRDQGVGKLYGIGVEAMEKMASNIGIKVEWAEEVNFGTMFQGLDSGRYDAICTPAWPDSVRAKAALFGQPMFYAAVTAYVRNDDHRFDHDLKKLNDPSVTLAVIDGNTSAIIAQESFPQAKTVSLPQNSPDADLLINVVTKKADATFWDMNAANQYLEANPGSIRAVSSQPLRVFPFVLAFRKGEHDLNALFATALQDVMNSGYINNLIDRYEKYPGSFYRVAKPYQLPTP
jgi:ABC-type amino acid transport substrate-binding protein